MGLQIAAVVGGGNIFRGVSDSAQGMDRVRPTTWACSPR